MRNLSASIFLLVFLNGCMTLDPMGLLPPSAHYMLMADETNNSGRNEKAISVEDLLNRARHKTEDGSETSQKLIFPILIPYDNFLDAEYTAETLKELSGHKIILSCGPFSIGDPITATTNALRACGEIQKILKKQNISFNAVFSPKDKADHATLKLQTINGDTHA